MISGRAATLAVTGPPDFPGTARFLVQRRLGNGAFGAVYEVYDTERDSFVALKTLHQADPDALYRFKWEFRALADISHPNLVALYELISEGELWFFTMELVRGVSFLEHVRDGDSFHEERLRAALLQLCHGLKALHDAGKLHRDIKPSNVLVAPDGQVKLLDFGMVAELGRQGLSPSTSVAGTPAFMSPEQAAGEPVSKASDLYAVGAILYQALTGQLPFSGEPIEVLVSKQWFEPTAPWELVPSVPGDLDRLCRELLRREPRARPGSRDVLRRLQGASSRADSSENNPAYLPFVGRGEQLELLEAAFAATRRGQATSVFLRGAAGTGKTALAKRFLSCLAPREPGAAILSGRCYQQESVPFKAVDSLIDALSDHLRSLVPADLESLVPHDVLALGRLFPVLRSVEAVGSASAQVLEIPDLQELRRRAFTALRILLTRIADRRPLVLFIDDVQWGDRDSADLLGELLREPDAPPLLFVAAYEAHEADSSPLLELLRPALALSGAFSEISVEELGPEDSRELARCLLDPDDTQTARLANTIAEEARGNPLMIHELVRYARSAPERAQLRETPLEKMILARVGALPPEARRLLEVVAEAGHPIELGVAKAAARIESEEVHIVEPLRTGHLLRGRTRGGREEVEISQRRVRETVLGQLPEEARRELHVRLASALEASGRSDPETLSRHFREAGDPEKGARYAVRAAEKAFDSLAFDQASRLYREALQLSAPEATGRWALTVKLGDALASAGRGQEAADAYLAALPASSVAQAVELRRRAAEQLLRSGHVDRGLATLGEVLRGMGYELAQTPARALASLLLLRARLRLRGLKYQERSAAELSPEVLVRIDTCWSLAVGLGIVDTIRGAEYQARHLLLALEAGEPYRVARALALEVGYTATGGDRPLRTRRILALAHRAARRVESPHARGIVILVAGMTAALEGRWTEARRQLETAEAFLRERGSNVAWELFNAQYFTLLSLIHLGEVKVLQERFPTLLKEAEARGDLYGATSLATRIAYSVHLAADRPDVARATLTSAMDRWSHQGFHMQHMWDLFGRTEITLYEGDGAAAWKLLEEGWPALKRSLLLRIQLIRIGAFHRRARAALAAAAVSPGPRERSAMLKEAERNLRTLEPEKAAWSRPLVLLARAGAAHMRGRAAESLAILAEAERLFEEVDMGLHAAAARRRRGLALGGEEGAELVRAADSWMAAQGIVSPERTCAMLAPGF